MTKEDLILTKLDEVAQLLKEVSRKFDRSMVDFNMGDLDFTDQTDPGNTDLGFDNTVPSSNTDFNTTDGAQ